MRLIQRLRDLICPTPLAASACVVQWYEVEARLRRIEEDGAIRSKKLNDLTDVMVAHMEREEGNMESHIRLANSLNEKLASVIGLLDGSGFDDGC